MNKWKLKEHGFLSLEQKKVKESLYVTGKCGKDEDWTFLGEVQQKGKMQQTLVARM